MADVWSIVRRQAFLRAIKAIGTLVLMGMALQAADKSGVSPDKISLPKGPGSIEGLGESFQPTLNTGTAKYSVALKLPPGTTGHGPDLALHYEGGGGNGPLGFGWSLPQSSIQRRTDKGIPVYGTDNALSRVDTFINEMKEELVPTSTGFYFCKNEGAFIRYRQVGDHWEGTLPNGTRLDFGLTTNGRIQDTSWTPARVFCWLLEKETDTRGNTIVYIYTNFPGEQNINQKYLSNISYGPGAPPWMNYHFVSFIYEDRQDWFEDCRAGFAVRTGKRLRSVVVGTQGPTILAGHQPGDFNNDGKPDNLIRRYDLEYVTHAGTNSHWCLLAKVTPIGASGTNALPHSSFGYSLSNPADQLSAAGREIGSANEPSTLMDNELAELVDLNGDGLPDILKTDRFGGEHSAFINAGETNLAGNRVIKWQPRAAIDPENGSALNFNLGASSTHLADMDGDGLADLVHNTGLGDAFFFSNRGRLAWAPRQSMAVDEPFPPSPYGQNDVRTADLDFDKRTDLVQSIPDVGYRIWFNLGGQRYSKALTVQQFDPFDFTSKGVEVADLNGDRVPDLAQVRPSEIVVRAGLGYGTFTAARRIVIPDFPKGSIRQAADNLIAQAKLADITGDGLADLVIERVPGNELWYWINLGTYTLSAPKVITGMPAAIGNNAVIRWADLNGNGTTDLIYADSESTPRLRIIDLGELINGGATPNSLVAITNGIGRVTLIGYQASTKFALDDAEAGRPWPDLMPFPVTVVGSVTNLDSLGHEYVTQFRYHNGYYDPREKQFRGFAHVEQLDIGGLSAPTLVTRSFFDTGRYFEVMKGKLLRLTAEQEDGRVFADETNSWATPPITLMTGTNGTNVVYVHPTASVKIIKELGRGEERRLESEFAYDRYGNRTANIDYGIVLNGDRSAFNDERITTSEYALNLDAWIIRHPSRQDIKDENGTVISRVEYFYDDETFSGTNFGKVNIGNLTLQREWITPANQSAFIKSSRTKYDSHGNPTTLLDPLAATPNGAVDFSKGHVRQIDYDARFHTYPVLETIHIGGGSPPLVFQAAYDEAFGTVTTSTDFNGNQTAYGYDEFARLTNIVKPGDFSAYPTVEYDYALAVPAGTNALVNFVETRQLDKIPPAAADVRRLTSESGIRNQESGIKQSLLTSAAAIKRDYYFISRQFVDGLGRKLLTKTEAEPAPGSTAPRVVVSEAVQFNKRQKPKRILNPFFSRQGGKTLDDLLAFESIEAPDWRGAFHENGSMVEMGLLSAHATTMLYDATLREIQGTNPDGTSRRTLFEPLVTKTFDENDTAPNSQHSNTPLLHFSDGLGRLVRVDEITRLNDDGAPTSDLRVWTTHYEYDLNDQLTRIIDSQRNEKEFRYDGLKRKTFMNDPDRGIMNFVYDDASNLIGTTDAKNQRISYTYDGANRILTEDYHDSRLPPPWRFPRPLGGEGQGEGADVVYHYDVPVSGLPQGNNTRATARNTKGALAYVWDLSGEEHTSYDARGRVEWTVKRIPDLEFLRVLTNAVPLVSYRTGFAYDSLDRVTVLTYPDNDEISYRYNDRSLLYQIVGGVNGLTKSGLVISNFLYQPSAQSAQIDYGNGVRTTYDYDSRLRLAKLHTRRLSDNTDLINFEYDFDEASNITAIHDRRPGSVIASGDKRRNTQLFRYDDLYRLTRAQYSFELLGEPKRNDGEINYRYDRIGNMLEQNSTIEHVERGLPVANLGIMESGGNLGRFGRIGRAANSPPGPHALSQIRNQKSEIRNREYPYDANGNMTNIDSLICTWDFKDRLIAVENQEMRAEYTYDYTDRRITKTVTQKKSSSAAPESLTNSVQDFTTLYPGKHFEVREHDAPTKYVWSGNTRVARVTGSLSTNQRLQRLRVYPGWNLASLAVAATNATQQLADSQPSTLNVQLIFKWNPTALDWETVAPSETLPGGTVLWLKASTNATLTLTGAYSDSTDWARVAGGGFLPGAGLELWNLTSVISDSAFVTIWSYEASSTRWLAQLHSPLKLQSQFSRFIGPGQVVFYRGDFSTPPEAPETSLRIRYYHQDHLTSSSALTDALGRLIEEASYYPFGHLRGAPISHGGLETYAFQQKEKEAHEQLQYFENRFLACGLSRFVSADPFQTDFSGDALQCPQKRHPYSFCENNSVNRLDPTGLFSFGTYLETDSHVGTVTGTMGASVSTSFGYFSSLRGVSTVIQGSAYAGSIWGDQQNWGDAPDKSIMTGAGLAAGAGAGFWVSSVSNPNDYAELNRNLIVDLGAFGVEVEFQLSFGRKGFALSIGGGPGSGAFIGVNKTQDTFPPIIKIPDQKALNADHFGSLKNLPPFTMILKSPAPPSRSPQR